MKIPDVKVSCTNLKAIPKINQIQDDNIHEATVAYEDISIVAVAHIEMESTPNVEGDSI